MFTVILVGGLSLVILQGLFAYRDGYLTQSQIFREHRLTNAYSFMEHGGIWADVFVVSPMVAYVMSRHDLFRVSWWNPAIFAASAVAWIILAQNLFVPMSRVNPEAHAHDGKVTKAGWVNLIFAIVSTWTILTFYFAPVSPAVSKGELLAVSTLLTPFFFLGVAKFTSKWKFERPAKIQAFGIPIVIWIVTCVRIALQ